MRLNSAQWNKEAIAKMTLNEFKAIYEKKVPAGTDLKELKAKVSGKPVDSGKNDTEK